MIILYFLAIGFIAIPLLDYCYCKNIINTGIEVEAIVLKTDKVNSDFGENNGYSYHPVFQYIIGDKQYETQYSTGNIRPKYSDGTSVKIYCHAKDPKKIIMTYDKTRAFIQKLFWTIGGVLCCVAILANCYSAV